ncbi:MAG: AtpZ/AtpI family protein [Planctomycetota bacterium]
MAGSQPPKWYRRLFGLDPKQEPADQSASQDRADARRKVWNQAGVGMEFAVGIGVFTAAGYGLDQLLSTHPGGLIVGALGGTAAAFYLLLKRMGVIPDPRPATRSAPRSDTRPSPRTSPKPDASKPLSNPAEDDRADAASHKDR